MELSKPQQYGLIGGVIVLVLLAGFVLFRTFSDSNPGRTKPIENVQRGDPSDLNSAASSRARDANASQSQ